MSQQPLPPFSSKVVSMPAGSRLLCAILVLLVATALAASGCGTKDDNASTQGSTGPSSTSSMLSDPTTGDPGTSTTVADVPTTDPASPNGLDRADVERWLAAPRFSYVGETDYDRGSKTKTGHLASPPERCA